MNQLNGNIMKKHLSILLVAVIIIFTSCRPSKKEQEAAAKAKQDSIVAAKKQKKEADSLSFIKKLKHQRDSLKADSITKVNSEHAVYIMQVYEKVPGAELLFSRDAYLLGHSPDYVLSHAAGTYISKSLSDHCDYNYLFNDTYYNYPKLFGIKNGICKFVTIANPNQNSANAWESTFDNDYKREPVSGTLGFVRAWSYRKFLITLHYGDGYAYFSWSDFTPDIEF